ncbi:hypothetical protein CK505_13965 [Kocuria sp. WN036]|uniref:NACHT domain-containing protein n=1 Tax=Kocuria sp. WN036 TaxID=2032628 RepID=UPI000BABD140|nr:NACHT domain-containing protein [Kocuria sp. WN036]PAU89209.1 hypothetical protein CK505_13965 [Kocuria sp. WN036]
MGIGKRDWRRLGWGVAVATCLVFVLVLVAQALGATGNEFDRWVDWASIGGLVVAAVTLGLTRWGPRIHAERNAAEMADMLTPEVLSAEKESLRQLLYAGEAPGRTANLTYQSDRAVGDLVGIRDFYMERTGRRMLILGAPGGGKSILALHLLCELARERPGLSESARAKAPVPVRFDLADWDVRYSFEEWLTLALMGRYTNLTEEATKRLINAELILPVLDGLDEMDSPSMEPVRARAAIEHLNRYGGGDPNLPVVVTCRNVEYWRIHKELVDCDLVTINSLDKNHVSTYMSRELGATQDRAALKEWESLSIAVASEWVFDLLETPWVLTLAVAFLRHGGSAKDLMPLSDELRQSYRLRIRGTLLSQYVMVRTCESGMTQSLRNSEAYTTEQVERWAAALARNLGDRVDIRLTDCWRIGGFNKVRVMHVFIGPILFFCALSMIVMSEFYWDIEFLVREFFNLPQIITNTPIGWIIGAVLLCLGAVVLFGRSLWLAASARIYPIQHPISLTSFRTLKFWKVFWVTFLSDIVAMCVFWFLLELVLEPAVGLEVGLAFALIVGIWDGVTDGLSTSIYIVSPASPVYSDLLKWLGNVLVTGFAGAIGGMIVAGNEVGFMAAFGLGLVIGFGCTLGLGFGQIWLRYMIGGINAAMHGMLPLRLNRFLVWAVRSGLMRRSGSAYQFRHLSLRNHFQGRPPSPAD